MTELLPCPFCGSLNASQEYDRSAFTLYFECSACFARGPAISTLSNDPRDAKARVLAAKDQWNMREGTFRDNANTA